MREAYTEFGGLRLLYQALPKRGWQGSKTLRKKKFLATVCLALRQLINHKERKSPRVE